MADMMTNFTAADMLGGPKSEPKKTQAAPKPKATKAKAAPKPKVEVEEPVETTLEDAQAASETVEEAPAAETSGDSE